MTIKQLGGVFGRNPTFNDVTIEGTLTFDGDIDINSDLKVNGDLDVIGDISGTDLDLSSATGPVLNLKNTDTNGNSGEYVGKIEFEGSDASGGASGVRAGVYAQYGSDFGFTSLDFQTAASGGAASSKMQIDGNGSIYVMNGNVIMNTSGSGIDFSATGTGTGTSTSELLADYEEGTWTPALVAGVGTLGSTSTAGTYTKVGRVVTISAYLKITDNGTGSTYLRVNGLPFPVAAYGGSTSAYENGVSGSATSIYVVNASSYFTMWKYNNTYPGATNATWYVSVSYFTS
jgi:hypothetical protein